MLTEEFWELLSKEATHPNLEGGENGIARNQAHSMLQHLVVAPFGLPTTKLQLNN